MIFRPSGGSPYEVDYEGAWESPGVATDAPTPTRARLQITDHRETTSSRPFRHEFGKLVARKVTGAVKGGYGLGALAVALSVRPRHFARPTCACATERLPRGPRRLRSRFKQRAHIDASRTGREIERESSTRVEESEI